MELLLQSFVLCHYRNLSLQVPMNRPIAEVGRADEGEAGQIAAGQVQPEPCGETQERGRGRHQKPRRSLAQPLHAEQINRVRLEQMEKTRHQVSSLADRLVCPAKLRTNPAVPAQLVQTWVLSAGGLQCAQCCPVQNTLHEGTQNNPEQVPVITSEAILHHGISQEH